MKRDDEFRNLPPVWTAVCHTALFACLAVWQAQAGEPGRWRDYVNTKYGYAVCFPANLLVPQGESDAGDGQAFAGSDGARLLVYGGYDIEGSGLADRMKTEKAEIVGQSGSVTYEALKGTWFVISGTDGRGIFYRKTIGADERLASFQLTYPAALRAIYDEVAAKLSRCLRLEGRR